mgnify:CR=1 FL=1
MNDETKNCSTESLKYNCETCKNYYKKESTCCYEWDDPEWVDPELAKDPKAFCFDWNKTPWYS